ncbi:hypothetical protein [Actinomycetospora lemnae]|uniref:Uncharacterized protein n=1 Tax=Actinomycetospora lemnae TaxID=3019891 RepID=A0ABT5T2R7_9PSEU|nr:hypothetical protein [Actinomycetospora sp. DW7H6]MDD7969309.1 hypothetical protein [Actinomycetospora sp. DW7H6]
MDDEQSKVVGAGLPAEAVDEATRPVADQQARGLPPRWLWRR